jgi:microcystin-dependent protein
MSGPTGTIPLQSAIPDQLITSALWNSEFGNVSTLMDASGCGGHSDTDADAQIQTAPYPGSVLSKATSIAGELERLRYVIAQILGNTYWYEPAATGNNLANAFLVGEVRALATSTVPSGFLACDGSTVDRTTYADLFAAISTTWNTGGEAGTEFRLPDLRGRTLLGSGTGTGLTARTVGDIGGEETHQLTQGELATHNHPITDPQHSHGVTDSGHIHEMYHAVASGSDYTGINANYGSGESGHRFNAQNNTTGITIGAHSTDITLATAGSDEAHNNMQPWACVNYVIKY